MIFSPDFQTFIEVGPKNSMLASFESPVPANGTAWASSPEKCCNSSYWHINGLICQMMGNFILENQNVTECLSSPKLTPNILLTLSWSDKSDTHNLNRKVHLIQSLARKGHCITNLNGFRKGTRGFHRQCIHTKHIQKFSQNQRLITMKCILNQTYVSNHQSIRKPQNSTARFSYRAKHAPLAPNHCASTVGSKSTR